MERLLMCLGIILIPAVSAKFQVQSEEKLVAAVGSDILLPCNLSPPLNRTGLEIRWFYNLFHSIVFLMREGREERQDQIAEFRGRAFLRDGPETGDLALSLLNVRLSDAGAFHCFVEDVSNQIYEEAVVNLSIVGKGSPPHIDISLQGSFIRLSCFSSGWYPEQKTHWLRNNKTIKPDSEASHKQSDGLFTTESEILLNSSSEGHFYCGVKHSMSGLETGAYIIVSEALFPRVSLWMISFILLLIILVSLLAVASWAYCRFKREKERDLRIKNNQLGKLLYVYKVMREVSYPLQLL
ncbi:butyrophilin subfamily 1 member A1 [Bombina bombina]|uniref:butyrophilin subfamily 1 member A1 n=1 Tax=Bombina bombina TaxID=8345 RepID=UPI00235A79A1|nr:butyrophilin subfamily 1 member A1 [Bombina bombina]